jgi:hypothetical protein
MRVDAVPMKKITKPLDLIAQRGKGCSLLLTGGRVARPRLERGTYCLGVHFTVGLDLDVRSSEVVCDVFE